MSTWSLCLPHRLPLGSGQPDKERTGELSPQLGTDKLLQKDLPPGGQGPEGVLEKGEPTLIQTPLTPQEAGWQRETYRRNPAELPIQRSEPQGPPVNGQGLGGTLKTADQSREYAGMELFLSLCFSFFVIIMVVFTRK